MYSKRHKTLVINDSVHMALSVDSAVEWCAADPFCHRVGLGSLDILSCAVTQPRSRTGRRVGGHAEPVGTDVTSAKVHQHRHRPASTRKG